MNIFVLDYDVEKCAEYHCDSHCVKMITEHNQILGSISYLSRGITRKKDITTKFILENFQGFPRTRTILKNDKNPFKDIFPDELLGIEIPHPYGIGYKNHPCTTWAWESYDNYIWLCRLNLELCKEYTKRYGKKHAGEDITHWYLNNMPVNLPKKGMTPFYLAMPDDCKTEDAVESYRQYYIKYKNYFATWKTQTPEWYSKAIQQ